MTSQAYHRIMWGVLLTGCLIPAGNFQIIPMLIGYIIIAWQLRHINNDLGGEPYFKKQFLDTMNCVAFSVVTLVVGLLFGYSQVITQMLFVIVMLEDVMAFGGILGRSVRILNDCDNVKAADKMRKNRMTYIKADLVVIFLRITQVVLIFVLNYVVGNDKGSYSTAMDIAITAINYICLTVFLMLKIWYSMFMYKMYSYNIEELGPIAKRAESRKRKS
ncbi:MAG: hypothetical protein LUE29_06700 [Lachnospiraceae bacterium]|nr:hypothetical protein [Lachnospiraceae bacterium]